MNITGAGYFYFLGGGNVFTINGSIKKADDCIVRKYDGYKIRSIS
jgi:hypothetical protein